MHFNPRNQKKGKKNNCRADLFIIVINYSCPKSGPQSRALCGAVCALSIAIVLKLN